MKPGEMLSKIENVNDRAITMMGKITIRSRDYPAIVKDVVVPVYIEDDLFDGKDWRSWVGDNRDLCIRAVSSSKFPISKWKWLNFRNLKKKIVIDLDFMVDCYLVQGNGNVSKDLAAVIEHLKEYVDPEKLPEKGKWRKNRWHIEK